MLESEDMERFSRNGCELEALELRVVELGVEGRKDP